MTTYINTATKEYPLYQGDMELRFQNFDSSNVPEGYEIVGQAEIPDLTDTQKIVEQEPVLVNDVWVKQLIVVEMSEEELTERKNAKFNRISELKQSGSAPNVIE